MDSSGRWARTECKYHLVLLTCNLFTRDARFEKKEGTYIVTITATAACADQYRQPNNITRLTARSKRRQSALGLLRPYGGEMTQIKLSTSLSLSDTHVLLTRA